MSKAVKISSGITQDTFTSHIGEVGRLFYNLDTGELKRSDGVTPGGTPVFIAIGNANIGNLLITNTTLSTLPPNSSLNLQTNGTGNINLVGNVGYYTTATGPVGTPLFSVDNLGNVVINGRLNVNGQSYFIGNETNFGNIVVNGLTTFNGASIINGDTTRTGNTYQTGNVNITGYSVNSGTSTFNGNTIFNGNVYHIGYTQFNGDAVHTGNIVITGITTNNGLSIFNGNLTIAGNASLIGNTTVTGNTLVTGFTTVTGNTLVTGNTIVVGQTYLTGNSYVVGNTFVTGTTTVTGNTYVTGQVTTITGNTYLQGNSFVTGTMSVTGNSFQSGLSTFIVSTVNSTQGAVEITGDSAAGYQAPINTGVMLQVTGQVNQPSRIYNDAQNNFPTYAGRRYNGNVIAPTQVLNNQDVVRLGGTGYTSGGWFGNGIARISLVANEDQTLTNQGSRIELWVTPNGSNSSSITNAVTVTANLTTVNSNVTVTGTITGNLVGNVTGTATKANVATNLSAASSILAGQVTIGANTLAKMTALTVSVAIAGLTTSHKIVVMPQADQAVGFTVTAAYPYSSGVANVQLQNNSGGGLTNSPFNLAYFAWI